MNRNPFTPAHEHFLRNLYAAERQHDRKLRAIARFLTLYAAAGAVTFALIAYAMK